jgi:putative ABC transport system permease protein
MLLLELAWKSLKNRRYTTSLTVASIALSVALLVGVERIRLGARDSFSNTISQTHLIVGARGGTLQLLLYSVFRMGNATNNISMDVYEKYSQNELVEWTIPISLGDSFRGYRVVSTNENFYKHYRYRGDQHIQFSAGAVPTGIFSTALGSEVAEKFNLKVGDTVSLTHGVMEEGVSFQDHSDKPFTITGVLKRTGTPVDKAVYITLAGMEAIHMDWTDGAPPAPGQGVPAQSIRAEDLKTTQITAFLMRLKSAPAVLRLQRDINTYEGEPLTAIIPGVALDELWRMIGYAEDGLRLVSYCVVVVGLLGMLVALLASTNERRREMAILRAVGAHPRFVLGLLVFEAGLLGTLGSLIGFVLMYSVFALTRPLLDSQFGILLPFQAPSVLEYCYLIGVALLATLLGFLPARRAYKNALVDGLTTRI